VIRLMMIMMMMMDDDDDVRDAVRVESDGTVHK
jgi:hypothetical protein